MSANTPERVGGVGLNVAGAAGILRVHFSGTVVVQLPAIPVTTAVTLTVVYGQNPNQGVVFSVREVFATTDLGPHLLTFSGIHYNAPVPPSNQLIYTLFLTSTTEGTIRVGPESFSATAYSD